MSLTSDARTDPPPELGRPAPKNGDAGRGIVRRREGPPPARPPSPFLVALLRALSAWSA
jgi:hypothetical protein